MTIFQLPIYAHALYFNTTSLSFAKILSVLWDVCMKTIIPIALAKRFFTSGIPWLFLMIVSLVFFTGCESQKTIVNGLDEKEANEIIVLLATKGIEANKTPAKSAGPGGGGGEAYYDINVPTSSATEAMAILNMNGLPRRRGQNLLGLFKAGGLVPSEMEEKIRYQAGLAEQIASTIRKIDGVLDADVQLSFPEEDPLNPGKKVGKVTSSVYVKHTGVLDDPNSHLITKIKRLVSSSVNGLDFDDVTVISDRARFSDIPIAGLQAKVGEEEKEYVKIWSIVIAKESLTRFRMVFFSFCIVLLLLSLFLIWMGWKIYPVLHKTGGIRKLFSLKPLNVAAPTEPKSETIEETPQKDTTIPETAKAEDEKKTAPKKGEKEDEESEETPEAS